MKKIIIVPLIFALFAFGYEAQQPDAKEIVRKANNLMMGRSSQSTAVMTVIRPSWTRKVEM
jgi:hypothetical protein